MWSVCTVLIRPSAPTLLEHFGSRHCESFGSLALECAGAVTSGSCNLCQAGAYQSGTGQPLLSASLRVGLVHIHAAACIMTMAAVDLFCIHESSPAGSLLCSLCIAGTYSTGSGHIPFIVTHVYMTQRKSNKCFYFFEKRSC